MSKLSTFFGSLKRIGDRTLVLHKQSSPDISTLLSKLTTDKNEAVTEIQKRRQNNTLLSAVNSYLNGDLPAHFNGPSPILYLSRHVATPNLETLKFIEVTKEFGLPIVIGEDQKGKFVSVNADKRSLGKMQIVKGVNRWQDEIIENFTLFDFKVYDGSPFSIIKTSFGDNLVDFHHSILKEVYPDIHICDESDWVNNNFRDIISEQYKRFLSLMVAHGVMFEVYYPDDIEFIQDIILPAFEFVTKKFGVKPLICNIFPKDFNDDEKDWIKYPSVIYPFVSKKFVNE